MQPPIPTQADADAALLFVELCFDAQPVIPLDILAKRLAEVLPESKVVSNPADTSMVLVHHLGHLNSDGAPAQTAIMRTQHDDKASLLRALDQTWTWPGARQAAATTSHQLAICEFTAQGLDYKTRSRLFHTVLQLINEVTGPKAIFFEYAQVVADPAVLPKASPDVLDPEPYLNVRLFQIEGMRPGDTLMDTRGLSAFGLPDFQIKFNGLNIPQVANLLINYAYHIYANGPTIQNGHKIQGLDPSQQWRCTLQNALVEPVRPVLDLDPGEPFALQKTQP